MAYAMKNRFGFLLLFIGFSLLAINLVGALRSDVSGTTRNNTGIFQTVEGYHSRGLTPHDAFEKSLLLKEQKLTATEELSLLLTLVSKSYIHLPEAYSRDIFDNWYLWLRGQFSSKYLDSQDPEFLWKKGGGFCHQAAVIFSGMSQKLGFESRIVWLDGHVISEVLLPEIGWQAFDPDLGVSWNQSFNDLLNSPEQDRVLLRLMSEGYSEEFSRSHANKYMSLKKKQRTHLPYLPGLFAVEMSAKTTKWLIPFILLLLGCICMLKKQSS